MAHKMSVLGIDIAKLVFHVVGMDDTGHVVLRKRIARSGLLPFIANLPPLCIGMEACGSAHYWARRFRQHGHDVKLIGSAIRQTLCEVAEERYPRCRSGL